MIYNAVVILLAAAIALATVNWAYFRILKIAKMKGLVDNPEARKLQKEPVPFTGGLAVFIGVLTGTLLGIALMSLPALAHHELLEGTVTRMTPVVCAMAIMIYVGSMDDILGMTPVSRLVVEVITVLGLIFGSGMCIDSFHGLWGVYNFNWWVAVPLTVFACVGIINSVNMIDGVNGLSSGLCMTCFVFYGINFSRIGDTANAVLACATAGALLPFLLHNVFGKRSKMFIGDAGTMMMGVLMCWFTICMLSGRDLIEANPDFQGVGFVALALAILSVPVFDTLRVMGMRVLRRRSPFSPDKTHLHHILIEVGISHMMTTVTEIVLDMMVVVVWAVSVKLESTFELQLYLVVASAMVLVWGTYLFLDFNSKRNTQLIQRLIAFSPSTHFGHSKWWLRFSAWLDAPEISEEHSEEHQEHLRRRFNR